MVFSEFFFWFEDPKPQQKAHGANYQHTLPETNIAPEK